MKPNFADLKAYFSNAIPQLFNEDEGSDEFLVKDKMMKFPLKVYEVIELENKIIVSLSKGELGKNFPEIEYWRAVFAYDFEGNVLWQVENPWYIDHETGKRIEYDRNNKKRFPGGDSVQGIWYEKEGDYIVAQGRVGYRLDTDTGKLLEIVWRER